jgi:ribonuclease E
MAANDAGEPAPVVAAPVMARAPAAPAAAPAAIEPTPAPAAPAPVVKPFILPMDELQGIAQSAGLQWVNSDADKIRAVQEAIASEPKPVHVPRERKPPVVLDEGPLILVETRKDLSQIKLPFENAA